MTEQLDHDGEIPVRGKATKPAKNKMIQVPPEDKGKLTQARHDRKIAARQGGKSWLRVDNPEIWSGDDDMD